MIRRIGTVHLLLLASLSAAGADAVVQTALPPPPGTSPLPVSQAPVAVPAASTTAPAPAAAPAPAPAPDAGALAAPAPASQTTVVGSLELAPLKSTVKIMRFNNTATCLVSNIRFRLKNVSNSDVKVGLIVPGLLVSDDIGGPLLGESANVLRIGGITPVATVPAEGWATWGGANAGSLTAVSPGQTVDVQIAPIADLRYAVCTEDPSSEYFRSYRPTSFSLAGAIVVADLDGNAQARSFSFSEVPLQAVAR